MRFRKLKLSVAALSLLVATGLYLNWHFFANAQTQTSITIAPVLTSSQHEVVFPSTIQKVTIDTKLPVVTQPFLQTV